MDETVAVFLGYQTKRNRRGPDSRRAQIHVDVSETLVKLRWRFCPTHRILPRNAEKYKLESAVCPLQLKLMYIYYYYYHPVFLRVADQIKLT